MGLVIISDCKGADAVISFLRKKKEKPSVIGEVVRAER
jgi:hypothetical protein